MWSSRSSSPSRQPTDDGRSRVDARLVVLVDHTATRRRLCARLAGCGYLVLADDLDADAAALVNDLRPEVVLVAWQGPNDPITAAVGDTARPGADAARPSWIALVAGDPLVAASALACGFDDVVALPHDPHEVAARVGAVLSRRRRRDLVQFDDVSVDLDAHEVRRKQQVVSLTATEFRLLVALLRHANQVLSKRQLLELVWGFDAYDTNVVEVQICALRRKLEVWGERFIHTVRGVGYVARQGAPTTSTSTP